MILRISLLLLFSSQNLIATFVRRDLFKETAIGNFDARHIGARIGHLDSTSCCVACVETGDGCIGFHVVDGECFLVNSLMEFNLKEAASPAFVWIRVSKLDAACSQEKFPFLRGRSRYRLQTKKQVWEASDNACRALGSTLAELTTDKERKFVANFVKSTSSTTCFHFVGLSKVTGGWNWYSSGQAFDISKWNPGEPNGGLTETRGLFSASSMLFYDDAKESNRCSICECTIF